MASDPDEREANVATAVRRLIILTLMFGMVAVLLDRRYALFTGVLFVPAGWVFWRPRPGQVALWAMWMVPLVMLGVIVKADRLSVLAVPSAILIGAIAVIVIVVLPIVRRSHRAPRVRRSALPKARVIR
ncbi:MAG TPA: hypothetical protein VIV11_37180 [Kofleriaceae bacterium]